MQSTSLRKGENNTLMSAPVVLAVSVQGLAADVSALLLGADGRVRSDDDLVFYNNPSQDGVSIAGSAVTADLVRVPADVDRVVVVVSADPLQPGAVFTRAPLLTINQTGSPAMSFTAPDFTSGETVVVLAELYRRNVGWKIRAVGQGYASGLAGLATDYGVDVEPEPVSTPASLPAQGCRNSGSAGPAVDLSKVERLAPGLLSPARQAGNTLVDRGIANRRAAVYLILDHDWHMEVSCPEFRSGRFLWFQAAFGAACDR
ncbi:TerD family protein [Streptomyces sp. NBC_00120]|uniref:TerD family protein n=1 Tax=Streptomyces sp. NBC_00120 TaxID=2975660 RepID=UPI00225B3C6B|nr:TerD family protein [Streptomyces sp. NBC_00120]MCX5326829.1 TerD family protein [Streptomyces sp. NBC_00120]